jgi:hypothetical protein
MTSISVWHRPGSGDANILAYIALISPGRSSRELLATLNSRIYVNRAGYGLPETRIYLKNHDFDLKTYIFPSCLTIGILGLQTIDLTGNSRQ